MQTNRRESKWNGASTRNRDSFSTNMWNDPYLAAFSEVAGLEMVTFDRGFVQYKLTACTILP